MIWLDNSRIAAIYAVVLLHVAAEIVTGNPIGSDYWWIGNIYDSAVRWCVPVFVMISGALLLDPAKKETLAVFYRKRLSRILIPIIVWSLFFLAWTVLRSTLQGEEVTATELAEKLLSGKPYYHMWFLYMIFSLYLFTPFFRKIVAHASKNELVFFIIITFAIAAVNEAYMQFLTDDTGLFINWFLSYIPFFFLGYFIRQDNRHRSKIVLWTIFLLSVILTFIGCYLLAANVSLEAGLYFYGNLSITVIPMSISLMYILKAWNKPIISQSLTKKLSILTLGIYLIHPILIEVLNYVGYGANDYQPIIMIPLVSSVVFFGSLAISSVIYRVPYAKRIL